MIPIRSTANIVVVGLLLFAGIPAAARAADHTAQAAVWTPSARIASSRLREASGIVASRRYPGVFWTHGDSGTEPALFAIDREGQVLAEVALREAPNTDWEDICADDAGHLYIGDIGNNDGIFPARYIYQLAEPDPYRPTGTAVKPLARIRFKYPDKKRFNSESMFWHAGSLYILPRQIGRTTVYRVTSDAHGDGTLEAVVVLNVRAATGADVSTDGTRLAVSSPNALTVLPIADGDAFFDSTNMRRVVFPDNGEIEGVCFDGDGIILGGEDGALYRVTAEQIEAQVSFQKPR